MSDKVSRGREGVEAVWTIIFNLTQELQHIRDEGKSEAIGDASREIVALIERGGVGGDTASDKDCPSCTAKMRLTHVCTKCEYEEYAKPDTAPDNPLRTDKFTVVEPHGMTEQFHKGTNPDTAPDSQGEVGYNDVMRIIGRWDKDMNYSFKELAFDLRGLFQPHKAKPRVSKEDLKDLVDRLIVDEHLKEQAMRDALGWAYEHGMEVEK